MKKITKKSYNEFKDLLTSHNDLYKKLKYNGYYLVIDDKYIIDEIITNSRVKYDLYNDIKSKWDTINTIYNTYSWDKLRAFDNCVNARINLENALNADTIGVMMRGSSFSFSYNALMKIKGSGQYVILVITKEKVKLGVMW